MFEEAQGLLLVCFLGLEASVCGCFKGLWGFEERSGSTYFSGFRVPGLGLRV